MRSWSERRRSSSFAGSDRRWWLDSTGTVCNRTPYVQMDDENPSMEMEKMENAKMERRGREI